jgi:hypothetical protein
LKNEKTPYWFGGFGDMEYPLQGETDITKREVNNEHTANGVPIQDRNDEGETNGPRRVAFDGEFNHGIGLRDLTDQYLSAPSSNRGFDPSVIVDSIVLMLQGGGRSLKDLRELRNGDG